MPPAAAFAAAPPLTTTRPLTLQPRGAAGAPYCSAATTAATARPGRVGRLRMTASAPGGWCETARASRPSRPARLRDSGGHPPGAAAASVRGMAVVTVTTGGGGGGGGSRSEADGGGGGERGGGGDSDGGEGCGSGGGSGGDADGAGGDGRASNPAARLLAVYLAALDARPLTVKAATAGVMAAAGDMLAQRLEQPPPPPGSPPRPRGAFLATLSPRRVAALTVVAAAFTAPAFHFLYAALEAAFPVGAAARNVWIQLGVDQLVAAPVFLAVFFPAFGLLSGRGVAEVVAQTRRDYIPSLRVTYAVFPVFQWASFTFLPPPLRVLAVNVVDLGFNAVLSYMANRPGEGGTSVA